MSETYARDIVLITYQRENELINMIKRVFAKDPKLPELLVSYRVSDFPCKANLSTILHLCVRNGDIRVVHQRADVLKNSFSVFFKN